MKYDDASWHYGGKFPADLPQENGATHIGMFLSWAIGSGLVGEHHVAQSRAGLDLLRKRQTGPAQFLVDYCDGKLTDEDLSPEGNAFASSYYDSGYLADYASVFANEGETLYHVAPTWENFDRLKPLLDRRLAASRRAPRWTSALRSIFLPWRRRRI
jgi:hypothetical protein